MFQLKLLQSRLIHIFQWTCYRCFSQSYCSRGFYRYFSGPTTYVSTEYTTNLSVELLQMFHQNFQQSRLLQTFQMDLLYMFQSKLLQTRLLYIFQWTYYRCFSRSFYNWNLYKYFSGPTIDVSTEDAIVEAAIYILDGPSIDVSVKVATIKVATEFLDGLVTNVSIEATTIQVDTNLSYWTYSTCPIQNCSRIRCYT